MYYLGIDCGTQGTKAVIFDPGAGRILSKGFAGHQIIADTSGCREQEAQWWVDAMISAVNEAVRRAGIKGGEIKALAVSGQQHGLVLLDKHGQALRKVKLWNDTSTARENEDLIRESGGMDGIWNILGSTLAVGYTASKVRYVAKREPDIFHKAAHILLPHDYLTYYLSGSYVTESSEASGTGYYDIKNRRYSKEMIERIDPQGILEKAVPPVVSWLEPAGYLRKEAADALGIDAGVLVAAGGGDNTMGALGTGAVMEGCCSIGIGTSGTVALTSPVMGTKIHQQIQIYEILGDKWIISTCTLNATSATTLIRNLLGLSLEEFDTAIASAPPGSGGIRCIPFFDGERVPAVPSARGFFKNISSPCCTRENMARAVMEGVSFTLRWGYDCITRSFPAARNLGLTGGGANSSPWRQMLADLFNMTVRGLVCDEGGAFGAALEAMYLHQNYTGNKISIDELCGRYVLFDPAKEASPNAENVKIYGELFERYREDLAKEWGETA